MHTDLVLEGDSLYDRFNTAEAAMVFQTLSLCGWKKKRKKPLKMPLIFSLMATKNQ